MKIVTVTDAWHPQVNGVVRTIEATNRELVKAGHTVAVIGPDQFAAFPAPAIPEIQLSLFPHGRLARTARRAARVGSARRSTSRPKARSARRRAAIAWRAACRSRPRTTRGSRST